MLTINIFLTQIKINQLLNIHVFFTSSPASFPSKNTEKTIKEIRFESQTQVVHILSELLYFKTVQINSYSIY